MKFDKLIKQTIDSYCKLFNMSKKELKEKLYDISIEDQKLIKSVCEMKTKSIDEFKKEYPDLEIK